MDEEFTPLPDGGLAPALNGFTLSVMNRSDSLATG
jgi:hypothetical protein